MTTLATDRLSHAFSSSIPLLAGPPLPSNAETVYSNSLSQVVGWGGGPVEALQLHSNTKSFGSSGSVWFPPRGGSGSRLGDAPTLTMKPGFHVSDLLLQLSVCKQIKRITWTKWI